MILAAIELENYKQYGGTHRIEFPSQGLVAITGPNGAGKTTLFEAIEWCLYGPRTIPHADVPPRDGVGSTVVRLTLEDPADSVRYVVQRELRKAAANAEVYREDQPEQPLVQGPRDVTRYVAQKLIGLDHAAFVSTFFTRQKELSFFGDRDPSTRRRAVARLLGFDTIRSAQEAIAEERNAARARTRSLREQYEGGIADRDFDAEIGCAKRQLADAQITESDCQQRLTETEAADLLARQAVERWRDLQARDATCEKELLNILGAARAAETRRVGAETELRRLERLTEERVGLAAEAARVEELVASAAAFEIERERASQVTAQERARTDAAAQLESLAERLHRILIEHAEAADAFTLEQWRWQNADDADPAAAASRLRQIASAVDSRAAQRRAELYQQALELSRRVERAEKKRGQYQAHRRDLSEQHERLLADGDPLDLLSAAEIEASGARQALEQALANLTAARREREESEELERIFDERSFDKRCPTCTRSLSDDEAARLMSTLRGATDQLRRCEADCAGNERNARDQAAQAEERVKAAADRVQHVALLAQRLADGDAKIADLQSELDRDLATLETKLAAAELSAVPTEADIAGAALRAEHAQRLAAVAGALEQLAARAAQTASALAVAESAIAAIGVVQYDAFAHRDAVTALKSAQDAAAELRRIDRELQGKSGYEATRDIAREELASLETKKRDVETARATIGFDEAALCSAREAETVASAAVLEARERLMTTRDELREAQAELKRVVGDRDRLMQLAAEAERCGREADELTRMYEEFSRFDRFVAEQISPLLATITERLLRDVTEGKYDHVTFDEDYGIHVYDGDQCFPLDGFSGGERDVVALCARLAMSELIGSAAARPPRFLVLDEVFGSLDSDRRAQLLTTLGTLATSAHVRQMFIISHVDDVQQSPVMNEAWTIEEREGVSRVIQHGAPLAVE